MHPEDVDVVLLCGGFGAGLKSDTGEMLKSMLRIGKRPLLEILIEYISKFGFKRFILAIGKQGKSIEEYFQNNPPKDKNVRILFSYEDRPLGTAGALKHCEHQLRTNAFIVLNGDTYCGLDYSSLLSFHAQSKGVGTLVVVTPDPCRADGGYIELDKSNRVLAFFDKNLKTECYFNAGIYVFDHSVLNFIQPHSFSTFENDIFPKLAAEYLNAFITPEKLYDLGTVERLEKFREFYLNIRK